MPTIWSRPARPLGYRATAGRRRVVLWSPYEETPPESCPICLSPLRHGEFVELAGCLHAACKGCMLRYAVSQWRSGASPSCPLCRSSASCGTASFDVAEDQIKSMGLARGGKHLLHFIEDCYHNWHCYATEHAKSGERYLTRGVDAARQRTFVPSATCWLAPYHGWIVPNGAPDANAAFERVERRE